MTDELKPDPDPDAADKPASPPPAPTEAAAPTPVIVDDEPLEDKPATRDVEAVVADGEVLVGEHANQIVGVSAGGKPIEVELSTVAPGITRVKVGKDGPIVLSVLAGV